MRLLLIFCLGILLNACSSLPDTKKIPKKDTVHKIYLVYEKWHTSIFIPAEVVERQSRFFSDIAVQKKYMRFGFGDGDYFTGKSKSFFTGAKALVSSDYSAMQVLDYWQDPYADLPQDSKLVLMITDASMKKLIRYIDDSVELNERDKPIALMAYDDNTGYFFKGKKSYGLFSNCNTWSSRALQLAGLPIRSRFKLTAKSVFDQAKVIADYQAETLPE